MYWVRIVVVDLFGRKNNLRSKGLEIRLPEAVERFQIHDFQSKRFFLGNGLDYSQCLFGPVSINIHRR